jgi:L-glutamine-phosphate cytidylyltransferase
MRAIIVAAGQGTRLRPLTNYMPKCLVKLESKPLLEYQLSTFDKCGITDINIVGGHFADKLKIYPIRLFINKYYKTTNMVYSLFTAEEVITADQDLIISYGDIIFNKDALSKLMESDADISVVVDTDWKRYWSLRMEQPLQDAETLKLTHSKQITEIGFPASTYSDIDAQYIGLIKISANKIKPLLKIWHSLINDNNDAKFSPDTMYMTDFIQHLIRLNWEVRAVEISAGWAEIDNTCDLDFALENFNRSL